MLLSLVSAGMSKTETEARCVAECRSCGQIFTAKLRADGSPRPLGIGSCTCGSDDFQRVSD